MKRRKRKYPVGDYGHRTFVRPPVLQVAMTLEPYSGGLTECTQTLHFAFHGASKVMLTHVFQTLRGRLFRDYSITEKIAPQILNGKCCHTIVVLIDNPDLHFLSVCEWPSIISYILERTFRCKVAYFDKYEKFLNA